MPEILSWWKCGASAPTGMPIRTSAGGSTCHLKKCVQLDTSKMKQRNSVFSAHYGKECSTKSGQWQSQGWGLSPLIGARDSLEHKTLDLERLTLNPWLCHLPAVCPWASYLISLVSDSPLDKMMTVRGLSQGTARIKRRKALRMTASSWCHYQQCLMAGGRRSRSKPQEMCEVYGLRKRGQD